MKLLKKQIKESFFNPILHFLPSLVFVVVDDFSGVEMAWKWSFPIAFLLVFYVYFKYKRMFLWHSFLSLGYLLIGLGASFFPSTNLFFKYIDEILFLLLLAFMFIQKPVFERMLSKTIPHKTLMSNNENELFRVARVLLVIVSVYLLSWLIIELVPLNDKTVSTNYLRYIYVGSVVFVALYESFRVFVVRSKLMNEDWLPVVDDGGKVVGSVQWQPDIKIGHKLTHPAVRLYFIENRMLLLQQGKGDGLADSFLWDASVSRLVRMSESVDMVLQNYTQKLYGIEPVHPLFLTNYTYETEFSNHYISLFVTCCTEGIQPQNEDALQTKWWTIKQIEENLGTGIFTKQFEIEFGILKRSGLFDKETCDCECALKDLIKEKISNK